MKAGLTNPTPLATEAERMRIWLTERMGDQGYTFTESEEAGERVVRMYRPDGSLAMTARKSVKETETQ